MEGCQHHHHLQDYKCKGDEADCNIGREISLLSTAGKVLARVTWPNRLHLTKVADVVLPGIQFGFTSRNALILSILIERQFTDHTSHS